MLEKVFLVVNEIYDEDLWANQKELNAFTQKDQAKASCIRNLFYIQILISVSKQRSRFNNYLLIIAIIK